MLKRLFLAFSLLMVATQPVMAQSWTSGARTVSYPRVGSSYTGVVGDGTDSLGGLAPAYATEPADVADNFTLSDWVTSSGASRTTGASEAKFRTHCNASHEKQEDPILFPGQANAGHRHTFFGNTLAGKDSTYTSLRTTGKSTCGGGPVNRTAYWFPSLLHTTASGAVAAIMPDYIIVYYTTGDPANAAKITRFPRDFKYIGGVDPSDYNDAARKAEIPGGFAYITNGFVGWSCRTIDDGTIINTTGGSAWSPRLKNADGSDPWGGACNAGKMFAASLTAPSCWDGYNRSSPNGRDHLRYAIRHIDSGAGVCPDHWYNLPPFQGTFYFSHNGFSDYGNWYLASDRMNPANTPADTTSLDPCRASGPYFCNGATFHFDWWGAWSYGTAAAPGPMIKWQRFCVGATIKIDGQVLAGSPADCNDSTFNTGEKLKLIETSPDTSLSNSPIVNITQRLFDDPDIARHVPLGAGTTGNFTVHHAHGG